MSRSKKKTPRSGDKKDKFFKRYENHRLRKMPFEHTLNHNAYKKHSEGWNICDYETVGISFELYWCRLKRRFQNKPELLGTKEEAYQEYLKWFIRK
jgi:hypothetical protein